MEKYRIFQILEIEETKDKNALKNAYRRKLVKVNPEDDPEGFKELRTAYEEAVALADQPDEEGPVEGALTVDDSPVGQWMSELDEIYGHMSLRTSTEAWKRLLSQDVCLGLDTADEVRKRCLGYLMDHFRLPYDVFGLLNEEFRILEDKNELLEFFPRDFLDYICFEITDGGFIDYSLFEGPDDGPYDEYINCYLDVKRGIDQGEYDQAVGALDHLKEFDIFHPFALVEQLRLAMKDQDLLEVENYTKELMEIGWENSYICLQTAAGLAMLNRWQEARELYEANYRTNPNGFPAGLGLLRCMMHDGEWEKAKELVLELFDLNSREDELQESLKEINDHLIPGWEAQMEAEPENIRPRLELGWCYYQNERYEECAALLENRMPQEDEDRVDYCNLTGRIYMVLKRYEEALPLLTTWKDALEAMPDDEEHQKKKRRHGYAWYSISYCLRELDRKEEALDAIDMAVKRERNEGMKMSYRSEKAQLLNYMERYQECVAYCDEILEENDQYFPAYVHRQKAHFELHHAQAVVDDYYNAVNIYPYYLPAYILAAKVFYYYDQYENSLGVIARARENGLDSNLLTFLEARDIRYFETDSEKLDQALEKCKQVLANMEKQNPDSEDAEEMDEEFNLTVIRKEIVFFYMDKKDFDEALRRVDEAIKAEPSDTGLLYAKAGIMKGMGRFKDALDRYQQVWEGDRSNLNVMGNMVDCLEELRAFDELKKICENMLAVDPENQKASSKLMHYYQNRFTDEDDWKYFEKAKSYADTLLRLDECAYYYIERGLLYIDASMLKEAEEDFKKAIEAEEDNLYAYNNLGFVYQLSDRLEEAIEQYKKAAALSDPERKSSLPWKNMSICYMMLGDFEKALECAKKNMELFDEYAGPILEVGKVYARMGRFGDALGWVERALKKSPDYGDAKEEKADILGKMGKYREAESILEKLRENYPGSHYYLRKACTFKMEYTRDYEGVYRILKPHMVKEKLHGSEGFELAYRMMIACYFLKKEEEYRRYKEVSQACLKECGGEEGYIGLANYASIWRYDLGLFYIYSGQYEDAKRIFTDMLTSPRCQNCRFKGCQEGYLGMALLFEEQGNSAWALEYFRKCLEIHPYDPLSLYYTGRQTENGDAKGKDKKKKSLFGWLKKDKTQSE